MVCDRCVSMVRQRLTTLKVDYSSVELGEVNLNIALSQEQLIALKNDLLDLGFELLDDQRASLIMQIKSIIIRYIHYDDESMTNRKITVLIAERLGTDYRYLSALFSSIEGITIEKYIILQRIERVKELLTYNELNLNEIAEQLRYSSVQHLSQQFKKVTGLTPSQYKQSEAVMRKPLDEVGL